MPPDPPVQAIVVMPRDLAASIPLRTFGELPLVLMAIAISPLLAVGEHLTGEERLKAVIVGDAGDGGDIGGEGNGR